MKKLFALSALATCGVLFAPSAMACSPNLPNYGNCVRQQQQTQQQILQAQQQGYSNYGGLASRSGQQAPMLTMNSNVTQTCRPAQDVHQICEYHHIHTGKLSSVTATNQNGDDVYTIGYQDGKVTFKTIYEYQKTKHGTLVKATTYDGNGKLDHINQEVSKFIDKKNPHTHEVTFYDGNGNVSRIEHRWMGNIVYSQEYPDKKTR